MMGLGGGFGLLVMVGLILGVVLVVIWAVQAAGQRNEDGPLNELRARYARGDIDAEQFEERRRLLAAPGGAAGRHMIGLIGLVLIIAVVSLSLFLGSDGWGLTGNGWMMRPTIRP